MCGGKGAPKHAIATKAQDKTNKTGKTRKANTTNETRDQDNHEEEDKDTGQKQHYQPGFPDREGEYDR